MKASILIVVGVLILIFSNGCSSYKIIRSNFTPDEKIELKAYLINKSNSDFYWLYSFKDDTSQLKSFNFKGYINDAGVKIPFDFTPGTIRPAGIIDSSFYIMFGYPYLKTQDSFQIKKYTLDSGILKIQDSLMMHQESREIETYLWKKEFEQYLLEWYSTYSFNKKTKSAFEKNVVTKIQAKNPLFEKEDHSTQGIISSNGKFEITQIDYLKDSTILKIDFALPQKEKKDTLQIQRIFHLDDYVLIFYFQDFRDLYSSKMAWLNLKSQQLKIAKIKSLFQVYHKKGKPVMFDNGKKIVCSEILNLKYSSGCESNWHEQEINIFCLNLETGKREWEVPLKEPFFDPESPHVSHQFLNQIFKLNDSEVAISIQKADFHSRIYNAPNTIIIINKKGKIKQVFEDFEQFGKLYKRPDGNIFYVSKSGAIKFEK